MQTALALSVAVSNSYAMTGGEKKTVPVIDVFAGPGNVRQLKNIINILAKRIRRQVETAGKRSASTVIYRSQIEDLLPELSDWPEHRPQSEPPIDVDKIIAMRPTLREARDEFVKRYIALRHQEVSGGQRSSDAYQRTADELNVSASTVKSYLRQKVNRGPDKDEPTCNND